jgi:hypothetical protein
VVWLAPTQTLSVVSTVATLLGTVAVNVVAGGAAPGTTATTQTSLTAQVVWLAPTQTLSVVSTVATLLGTVAVNVVAGGAAPGTTVTTQTSLTAQLIWLAPTQTMNVTVLSTAVVTLATGGTIATLLGTQQVTDARALYTTTGISGSTGMLVWIGASQTIIVNTAATIAGASVTIQQGASVSLGSLATIVGTTTATSGVTGPIVWLGVNQTLATVQTVVTLLGTVAVNIVAGGAAPGTTATTQTSLTAQVVWLAPTQTITVTVASTAVVTLATGGTLATLLGTVAVNIVAGGAAPGTTATTQTSLTAQVVWLAPTQTATVNFSGVQFTTTASGLSGVTGVPVWLANPTTVTVTVTVTGITFNGGYYAAVATTSTLASSTNLLLMSVYVSTGSTLGTAQWTVGSGSALIIYGLGFGWSQPAAANLATFALLVTTSNTTISTVSPAWAQVTYTNNAAVSTFVSSGWFPGTAVGINTSLTTLAFPWVIPGPAVVGLAVVATSSGATVYASIQASVVNTVPFAQPVTGTVTATGLISVANATTVVSGTISVASGTIALTGTNPRQPWLMLISSTPAISAGTSLAFTIYTGITQVTVAGTQYPVPAGKNLVIYAINGILGSSASTGFVADLQLVIATTSASFTSGSIATIGLVYNFRMLQSAIRTFASVSPILAVVPGGTTLGINFTMSSSITVSQYMIQGYLEG